MLKLIVLAFAGQLMTLSFCQTMSVSKRGHVQLCGRLLAETLNLLCQGQYYDPGEENVISKREFLTPHVGANFYPVWYLQRINEFGRRPMLPASRRQERGVVDECCKQSCSPAVLLSYCRTRK